MEIVIIPLFRILNIVLNLIYYVVIIDIILSWLWHFNIISYNNRIVMEIKNITRTFLEPIYVKLRSILPVVNSLDFSPLILILIIIFLQSFLFQIFMYLM